MGQSISTGSILLENAAITTDDGKHVAVSISSRSDGPPGYIVSKEIGLISAQATKDIFSNSHNHHHHEHNNNIQELQIKAKDIASTKCATHGGNALLATQIQILQRNPPHNQHHHVVHLIGTCVRLEKQQKDQQQHTKNPSQSSSYAASAPPPVVEDDDPIRINSNDGDEVGTTDYYGWR